MPTSEQEMIEAVARACGIVTDFFGPNINPWDDNAMREVRKVIAARRLMGEFVRQLAFQFDKVSNMSVGWLYVDATPQQQLRAAYAVLCEEKK